MANLAQWWFYDILMHYTLQKLACDAKTNPPYLAPALR